MIEYNKFMNQKSNSKYDLEDKLIEFAVRIIEAPRPPQRPISEKTEKMSSLQVPILRKLYVV